MVNRLLWVVVVLAVVISAGVGLERANLEEENREVELVVDFDSAVLLAEAEGVPLSIIYTKLAEAGVKSIALRPRHLGEHLMADRDVPETVAAHYWSHPEERDRLYTEPVAFWSDDIDQITAQGLMIVPRLANEKWDNPEIIQQLQHIDPKLLIFGGVEVYGYPNRLDFTRMLLLELESRVGLIEFSNQKGMATVADGTQMVRVHAVTAREMEILSIDRIVSRYVRAVRERNIRVLYVRPFVTGKTPLAKTTAMLRQLTAELDQGGFVLGRAVPFVNQKLSFGIFVFIFLGVWAGAFLLFERFVKINSRLLLALFLLAVAATSLMFGYRDTFIRQGMALLAAVVFPVLGLTIKLPGRSSLAHYFLVSAVSLCGAALVVSLLTGSEFLVKLAEFRGVKLMHVLPIGISILYWIFFSDLPLRLNKIGSVVKRKVLWGLNSQVPFTYLLLGGVLLLFGYVYLRRTGNFGLPILQVEVIAREWLERVLVIRPRTKEFLIGHPALWVFLVWRARGDRRWLWITPLAVIGQLSMVNTFTHIHTPLYISVIRTMYGLLLGLVIGWLAQHAMVAGKELFGRDSSFRLFWVRKLGR